MLLAACRPSESAYEYAFEKDEKNGALTYWLLKSFQQVDKGFTYKIIHDRLVAKVHSQFPLQTPMLEGDADREIFGSDRIQAVYAVNVMQIDPNDSNKILLNAGAVHGIRRGTKFAIYPLGFTDFSQVDKRVAIVEIQERGSTNSWARINTAFTRGNIEQGAQAVLIDPVDINLKRMVRLVYQGNMNMPSSVKKTQKDALDQIKKIIIPEGKGFLELASRRQRQNRIFK